MKNGGKYIRKITMIKYHVLPVVLIRTIFVHLIYLIIVLFYQYYSIFTSNE